MDNLIKEPFVLDELKYFTDVQFETDEFDYLVGLKRGQIINLDDLKNVIYYLYLKNRFESVLIKFEDGKLGKKLHFKLTAFWQLKKLTLNGISYTKENYLEKYIIKVGDYFDENKHLFSIEQIKHLCNENGFLDATVNPKIKYNIQDKSVFVELDVVTGKKFLINEVILNCEDADIEIKLNNFKNKLIKASYNTNLIANVIKDLKLFLKKENYPFAKIKIDHVIDYENKTVKIIFNIKLQDKLKLEFINNKIIKSFELEDYFFSLNYPIQELPISTLTEEIKSFYKKKEFYNTDVEILKNDYLIQFKIDEGKRNKQLIEEQPKFIKPIGINDSNKFGKIILKNDLIPFKKIIKEINVKENNLYKKKDLDQIFYRLNKLNLFESVNFDLFNDNDFNQNKPVVINMHYDEEHEFRIKVGFQQFSNNFDSNIFKWCTPRLNSSVLLKNKLIDFDQVILNADLTLFYQKFNLIHKTPWFFEIPINYMTRIYFNNYFQPLFFDKFKNNLFKLIQEGLLFDFSTRNSDLYNFNLSLGFENLKISELDFQAARTLKLSENIIDQNIPYFFVEPKLTFQKVDDYINPQRGCFYSLDIKSMISNKFDNSFIKIIYEQNFFTKIWYENIFAFRLVCGHIFIKDFKALLPNERFYLGGPNSVRSYEPDFTPPFGVYKDSLVPQGGTTMANLNLELRIPLSIYKNLNLVLFNDQGVLFNKYSETNNLLWALGFGLRYDTFIGPLRFDIGFRNKNFRNDYFFAWYFTIGHSF